MANITALMLAFLMDCIVGDPYWFPHPVRFIGKLIRAYEKKFYKPEGNQRLRGLGLVIVVVSVTALVTLGLIAVATLIHPVVGFVAKVLVMWTCLAHKCLGQEANKVFKFLAKGDLPSARQQVGYLVARQTDELTEEQVSKAVIETVVENTSDGIIAPLFYMAIGGPVLGMVYKSINTMDSMVGYKNDKYMTYGTIAAKVDDVANYIPARITGFLMVITAFLLGMDGKNSFKIFRRDCRQHSSPNAGFPESATAGALGIQLGGGNVYFGKLVKKPTIGEAIHPVEGKHIKKSITLMSGSSVLFLALTIFISLALWKCI